VATAVIITWQRNSPYKATASDGKDPGADIDAVNQFTQGVD